MLEVWKEESKDADIEGGGVAKFDLQIVKKNRTERVWQDT